MKHTDFVSSSVRRLRDEEVQRMWVLRGFDSIHAYRMLLQNDDNGENNDRQRDQYKSQLNDIGWQHMPDAVAKEILLIFKEALGRDAAGESATFTALDLLLRDISDGLRASHRLQGDHWRLTIRLSEELFRQTNLELACNGGKLSVTLRTSDRDVYRCLVDALVDLNEALEQRGCDPTSATVYWVNPEELE